ncbi:MAG TPA: GspH/FimT family pseudopilin [Gemmatimonadaceae bacterium]|nr:GspH/FimT family pseudopilin [Gemmatimonadaceae bacterium]
MLELTLVLMVAGMLFAIAAPHLAAMRDSAAVHAATSDMGSAFSLARQSAVERRALTAVVVDTAAGQLVVRSGGRIILRRTVRQSYGVSLGSNRDSVVYDPHGLGYGLSNLTLTARRGSFVDTLTMSRLGRLRY